MGNPVFPGYPTTPPPVRPPLQAAPSWGVRVRAAGTAIADAPNQNRGWGTLQRPKRIELPLGRLLTLTSRLGFEAEPSTDFWQFKIQGDRILQVNRISGDPLVVDVGVALLDASGRRVAALVDTAGGVGAPVTLAPGTYLICAAVFRSIQIEFKLELRLQPAQSLRPLVPQWGEPQWGEPHGGSLNNAGLRVAADPMEWDTASTLCGRGLRLLAPAQPAPFGPADGVGFIGIRGLRVRASPMGAGDVALSHAALSSGRYHQLRGATKLVPLPSQPCQPQWGWPRPCRLAKVTVLWRPQESWRLRLTPLGDGNRVEVNSAYSLQRPYPG
jgi:hypothetical protein